MILPATVNFQAIQGGTFDATVTLYQGDDELHYEGRYDPTVAYTEDALVLTDDLLYAAVQPVDAGVADPPADDAHMYWRPLTPVDLTGWSAVLQIGDAGTSPSLSVDSSGPELTLGDAAGTVAILLSPAQTLELADTNLHYYVQATDSQQRVYFPLSGKLKVIGP